MQNFAFPKVVRRVKAVIIDSIIIPVVTIASIVTADFFGISSSIAKLLFLVCPIIILEPFLVSYTGSSIGHRMMGLKVTKTDGKSNIGLSAATARLVVKSLLGWLSFIFILTTKKRQALHDVFVSSLVVYIDAESVPAHQIVQPSVNEPGYVYPSWWRRIVFVIAYLALSVVLSSALWSISLSDDCVNLALCSESESIARMIINMVFMASICFSIAGPCLGKAWGCRRTKIPHANI